MDLVRELVDEWRSAVKGIRDSALARLQGVRIQKAGPDAVVKQPQTVKRARKERVVEKECAADARNARDFDQWRDAEETLLCGSTMPSPIPVIKNRVLCSLAAPHIESKLRKPSVINYGEIPGLGTEDGAKENKMPESANPNARLNAALMLLKKKCIDRANESMCGAAREEFRRPVFNTLGYQPKTRAGKPEDSLYKQAIDSQLAGLRGVPQHMYRPRTRTPALDEDSDVVADPCFVAPDFAADPALNGKVQQQDHRVLEKYFSCGHDIDIERLFPHVKNVSNSSPNKWPVRLSRLD